MTLPAVPGGVPLSALVLVVVLVVGVVAGRAKGRYLLLLVGVVGTVVAGAVLAGVSIPTGWSNRAAWVGGLLPIAVPLLVAFLAGWLCGRASWFFRILVLAAAALLVAFFPYAAVTPMLAGA